MRDRDEADVPEDEAPRGRVVAPPGGTTAAIDDGSDDPPELDDEDADPVDD